MSQIAKQSRAEALWVHVAQAVTHRWQGRESARFSHWVIAAVAAVVVLASFAAWWFALRPSLVERAMDVLREAHGQRRLVEARISGGFPYAPYELTRGTDDHTDLNDQRLLEVQVVLIERALKTDDPAARHALGRLDLTEQKFDDAERKLAVVLKDDPGDAEAHNDLGVALFGKGHLAEALRHFDKAVELDSDFLEALFNRALCDQRLMLLHAAQNDWERYLKLETDQRWIAEGRNHLEQIEALIRIDSSERKKQIQEEFKLAYQQRDDEKARRLFNEYPFWIEWLAANQTIPEYLEHRQQGKTQAAEEKLRLSEYIGSLLATLRSDQAVADAVRFYQAMPRRTWSTHLAAYRQYKKGAAPSDQYDYKTATSLLRDAGQALTRLGDPLYSERAELLIVKNLYNQKDYVACLNSLSRILPQLRKRSHKRHEIYALSMLGSTYDSLGNHSQALVYLRQALALEEANNLFGGMADFLNFVGTAQMHLGQYDLAIKAYEQALKVGFGYVKSLSIEAIYQNLAYVYMVLKDYEMASRYQEEALFRKERASDLDPYYFSNTLTNAAQIYIDLKDYDKARRYLERALKVNQTIKDPNQRQDADVFALLRLGRLYRSSGDFEGATRILDQCRALPTQDQENRLDVSFDSARTLLALGQYALAREEFDRTIQLFDRNRALLEEERERNFFFTRSKDIYDEMTLLLYNHLGDVEVAFDYSERSKARTFLDLVLGKFRLITEKAKSEMRLFGNARPRHYAEIAAGLPEDVSLLHYAVTREAIIVWLINHGRPLHTIKIPMTADDLQQRVEQFLAGIKQPAPLSQVRAQAQELYTDLIGPLVPFLEPGKTVCIIPDGVLHYLPFAALVSPATGRYLVEDYPISTSPSASIFLRCLELGRQKSLSRSKLLAIGNPSVDPQFKLAPLPFAEREVEQIARYYPMATKLLGSGASEDRVRQAMPQANAIHFATHGLIREREAMYSALMLASGRGNPLSANILEAVHPNSRDGLLKVFELYEVRLLQTSLVVLSACESGLGEFFEGEGIIGLARPFIHAGVPTLVVSLWPISDSSATVDLMARFHQRWQTGYRAATALREAQIRLLSGSQYQHPYYWASFLVMGSGQ